MSSKIRIKMGAIEIEYEGSEDFLKQELPELLSAVSKLHKHSTNENNTGKDSELKGNVTANIQATTATIASKLKCTSGADLIIAAAAKLYFALQQTSFTRQQLIDEMKNGGSYFKKSYTDNLTNYIDRLRKNDRIREISSDTYTFSPSEKEKLESQLVDLRSA